METTKYLFKLYPESISIRDDHGFTMLHRYSRIANEDYGLKMLEFLLQNDQGAVSSPENIEGQLPLHIATFRCLAAAKSVFNAYPNAIHTADNNGYTPLDNVRRRNQEVEIIDFLEQQIQFERQARLDRTTDNNGRLPIHRVLRNEDASVGGIKLMLAANQTSITVADNQGHTLLHIACQAGNLDAVKYFMGIDHSLLKAMDTRGNLPLHLACMEGNFALISCILEQSTYGVSLQNSDKLTPIELLLFESECDRDSMDYVEAVRLFFQVNPLDTLKCLMKKEDCKGISDKRGDGTKRQRV